MDAGRRARVRATMPHAIWSSLGSSTCVVEKGLDLEGEISVMVARRPDGSCATFPPALNHHVNGVLDWSVIPAPVPARRRTRGRAHRARRSPSKWMWWGCSRWRCFCFAMGSS